MIAKPRLGATINWNHPLAKDLIGCWLMNENGGTTINDLAKGNHGTIQGTYPFKDDALYCDWEGGDPNGAIPYVQIPDSENYTFTQSDSFSIVSGFKLRSFTGQPILWRHDSNQGNRALESIRIQTGGNLACEIWDGASWPASYIGVSSDNTVTLFQDTIVGYVRNRNDDTLGCYLKGILKTVTDPTWATINPSASLNLGAWYASGQIYGATRGWLYFSYLYKRALTVTELKQLEIDPYCFLRKPSLRTRLFNAVQMAVNKTNFFHGW